MKQVHPPHRFVRRPAGSLAVLVLLLAVSIPAGAQSEFRVLRDLRYHPGPTGDSAAHSLDLYLPAGEADRPLLLFVHGGAWRGGDKSAEGLVNLLELLLSRGYAVASTNYRVSPAVRHPVHVQDVARAFAWLHRNARRYSLDRDGFFVAGHSAGGHLVALLGTEARFLGAEGLPLGAIRGVIASSGVYDMLNRRGPGMNMVTREEAFGEERAALQDASPAWKVARAGAGIPPFLITYTEEDLFGFAEQARNFYRLLLDRRLPAHLVEIPARTHLNVLPLIGKRTVVDAANPEALVEVEDQLGPAIVWFLEGVRDGSLARAFSRVWPPGGPEAVAGQAPPPMQSVRDVPYYDGPGSDPRFHGLDLPFAA